MAREHTRRHIQSTASMFPTLYLKTNKQTNDTSTQLTQILGPESGQRALKEEKGKDNQSKQTSNQTTTTTTWLKKNLKKIVHCL